VDDRSIGIVGAGTIQFKVTLMMYYVFLISPTTFYLSIKSLILVGGKTVEFLPHQVVIKDLKDPKHIVATGTANNITRLYKFDNFGS
jgi:hypothetical protein